MPEPIAPLFTFRDFDDWVNTAVNRFRSCGVVPERLIAVDASGRVVRVGSDFIDARSRGAFPISVYRYRDVRFAPVEAVCNPLEICVYCEGPAQGNYSIHETDDFDNAPDVPLCDRCGGNRTPTIQQIWDRIAERKAGTP